MPSRNPYQSYLPQSDPERHHAISSSSYSPEPEDLPHYPGLYSSSPLPEASHFFPPMSRQAPSTDNLYPSRPLASARDSSNLSDSDLTNVDVGTDSPWVHVSPSMLALNKLDDPESEGMGLVHPPPPIRSEKRSSNLNSSTTAPENRRRKVLIASVGLLIIVLAIIITTVLSLRKNRLSDLHDAQPTASGRLTQLWGRNGDKVTTENGTVIEYKNPLGGTWVTIPFNDTAKCQDDSPPLNQPWDYARRRILGVNLGGWLVLEPFITPYLFEPYNDHDPTGQTPTVVDEWTLSVALGDKLASTLEEHYRTFITEEDFIQIAAAGLNWIRLPVGYWMIETFTGEPFLAGVSQKYFLKALKWARKYGLRVNLDLHAVPGSQNGFNHSGKLGSINFLIGLMGVANAQRTLNYIRTLTEFISQPQYVNVVPMFTVLNEALTQKIGPTQMRSFYLQAYQMMRGITGYGLAKGPMMVIHDGFQGTGAGHLGWAGFLKGADRLALDTHNYFAFDKQSNDSLGYAAYKPCTYWAKQFNQTNTDFGFNFAGEYSLAINDCGLWLNNIGVGSRYDGTYPNVTTPDLNNFPRIDSCDLWKDYRQWTPDMKTHIADLAAASQDAMQNSFFWTWKISRSIRTPDIKPNPLWDYQLGLQQGWIRQDARANVGACAVVAAKEGATTPVQSWKGEFEDWQTGSSSNTPATIDPNQLALYGQWPPKQIYIQQGQDPMYPDTSNLPQYSPTGQVVVLKSETPNPDEYPAHSKISSGTGWSDESDRAGWYVPIKGCQYPDPWAAGGLPTPTSPFCSPA